MFGKKKKLETTYPDGIERVETGDVDVLQRTADQKEIAENFINEQKHKLLMEGVHVWHAPQKTQVQLALATTALTNDRTAEILLQRSRSEVNGTFVVPADVHHFASVLSQNALDRMNEARHLQFSFDEHTAHQFDDDFRNKIQPEAQLPYWPAYPINNEYPEWQGEDIAGVSTDFLQGIITTARELQYGIELDMRELATTVVPPEYEAMPSQIIPQFIGMASLGLETAETLFTGNPDPAPPIREQIYNHTHDAYIHILNASLGAITPPFFGDDFAPIRD